MAERGIEDAALAVRLRPGERQVPGLAGFGQAVCRMSIQRQQHRDAPAVRLREHVNLVEDAEPCSERTGRWMRAVLDDGLDGSLIAVRSELVAEHVDVARCLVI